MSLITLNVVTLAAGDTKAEQRRMFALLDGNKDGKVTEKEFVITVLYQVFRTYDTNGDKMLSKKEFLTASRKSPEGKHALQEWKEMDTDGDGSITFEESLRNKNAIQEMKDEFKKLDKEGSGSFTLADVL